MLKAAPYAGFVLHGITENSPPSIYIRDVLAPAFERETGIRIDLTISDNVSIEQAIARGGGEYDFAYLEQDVIYGYLEDELLIDLTQMLTDNPNLISPAFNLMDFTDFIDEFKDPATDHLFGVPIEAFIKVYAYRTDLFEDPAIRAEFEAQYHYPLAPAITFEQYHDIAAFFTDYGRRNGLDLWGTSLQATTDHVASFYEFIETIAPTFGVYNWGVNLETGHATSDNGGALDSDAAKDALRFWIDLLQFAPPDADKSTWSDVADAFAEGRVAQGWLYGEYVATLATDPQQSAIVDHLGVTLPPTAPGVAEDALVGEGYIGYYDGAAFGIPKNSSQAGPALLWLQYLGQSAVQPEWAVETSRVVHLSTFDDPLVRAQDQRLQGYFTLVKKQGNLFAGAPPFPFHSELRDVITSYIQQAIRGDVTPEAALDQAALAADELLAELGVGD